MNHPKPALVGDIGGTNARFALVQPGRFELEAVQVLACADYPHLEDAARAYLQGQGIDGVSEACMAFACPVHGEQVKMTNNHWSFAKTPGEAGPGAGHLQGDQRFHRHGPGRAPCV